MAYESPTKQYQLGRDAQESHRLGGQHEVVMKTTGFYLHPRVAHLVGENSRIADMGTGTGIWLLELASQLPPSCSFVGFDASDAQFPSGPVPSNVTFKVADARDPIPDEFRNSFDIVHVRLIQVGLDKDDFPVVFQNLTDLLKPGGALQWIEIDGNDFVQGIASSPNSSANTLTRSWQYLFQNCIPRAITGYGDFLEGFRGFNALKDKEEWVTSTDRLLELRELWTKHVSFSWPTVLKFARTRLGQEIISDEEFDRMMAEVDEEIAAGAYIRGNLTACLGFKP